MANPLVDHLREGVRTAGEGMFARLRRWSTPAHRQMVAAQTRQRPLTRIFVGTTVAFACGVGLGVGVAAVIAPEAATIRDVAVDRRASASHARGGAGGTADPVVAVRLRQDGAHTAPRRAPAETEPLASLAAPVPITPGVEPAPQPAYEETAPVPLRPAEPPRTLGDAAKKDDAAPAAGPVPLGTHGQVPLDTAPAAIVEAAPGPVSAPVAETAENAAAAVETAPAIQESATIAAAEASGGPVAKNLPPEAGAGNPAGIVDGAVSEMRIALGPSGLDDLKPVLAPADAPAAAMARDIALPPRPRPKNLQLAALPMPRADAWIRNAVAMPDAPHDVMIAIIVDDMGIDQKRSKAVIGLPAPLTLSFIPYGYHLRQLIAAARAAGHEVMLHLPMEPLDREADPGPNALRTTVTVEENRSRLLWALSRVEGIVGINNHMGSKFTTWRDGMAMVMQEVQDRGLLFVDSFTNNESVGYLLARERRLPSASRDVFIDHDIERVAIEKSLGELERVARRRGYAVGIAHPHDLTREALRRWMTEAEARGVDFVPISHIVRRRMKTG